MTPKLLALTKECSDLVNIRDVLWLLWNRGSELDKGEHLPFGQKWSGNGNLEFLLAQKKPVVLRQESG